MTASTRREVTRSAAEPERDPDSGEASVTLLLAAMGRVVKYGGELAVLEARALRRGARRVARFHTATWMCALTAWLALNAGLALLAYTRLGIDPGITLLLFTAVNGVLAVLAHSLRRRQLRELTRRPIFDFLDRRL